MKLAELGKIRNYIPKTVTKGDMESVRAFLRSQGIDPDNFYQEIEMTSRFVDTHRDVSFSNAKVSLHSHNFYEILYCTNTCGAEYLLGPERYRLQKGDIIFIPPGISHRPLLPAQMPEPYQREVLWVNADLIRALEPLLPIGTTVKKISYMLRTAGTQWEFLGKLFHAGVQESEQQKLHWESAVLGNTITLLTHLYRAMYDHRTPALKAEKQDLLAQVLEYIDENLSQKLTLSDTAKHFFVSESTISQTFRKQMDISFYHFVTQRRLIAAKTLILEGAHLDAVNERVGFSDYSTFYRAFKQEYGISPRQFRKLHETGSSE